MGLYDKGRLIDYSSREGMGVGFFGKSVRGSYFFVLIMLICWVILVSYRIFLGVFVYL